MNRKKFLSILLISFIFVNLLFSFFGVVLAQSTDGDQAAEEFRKKIASAVDKPIIKQIFGVLFGVWHIDDTEIPGLTKFLSEGREGVVKTASIIIYFLVWFILFFVFRDLFGLFTPFGEGVTLFIALALTVVAAQLKWIISVSSWLLGIAAILGAVSVWVEIIILIFLLIVSSFGAQKTTAFVAKIGLNRRIAREALNTTKGAAETKAAIKALREAGGGFE